MQATARETIRTTWDRHRGGTGRLPVLLTLALIGMVTIEAIVRIVNAPQLETVQRQVDITTGANLAATFSAGVLAFTGLTALAFARASRQTMTTVGWILVSAGLFGLAAVELLSLRAGLSPLLSVVPIVAISAFLFLDRQVRDIPGARLLLVAGFCLVLSNPVTEYIEVSLTGNPENYTFVAPGQNYRFNSNAWIALWVTSRVQEATEVGAVICILAALRLKMASIEGQANQ